eukprot:TRINITY_DN68814_c0_g1_i1.p1 TRINITY_DN68814_c0_g1~~TRINITY_DN68814_c0_g1_i1.p1  ORF type:complete len:352 (+),score=41.37 TRINITY_DN68814_c0_g1_i1:127-1182(+)
MGGALGQHVETKMDTFVFPALEASYDTTGEHLVKMKSSGAAPIPAMLLPPSEMFAASWTGELSSAGATVPVCVMYFHANACDIGDALKEMRIIRDEVFDGNAIVVAPEYTGYGLLSDYKPSAESIDLVAMEAWRFCRGELGFDAERIVLWGRSLGTGPASALARSRSSRAVKRAVADSSGSIEEAVCKGLRPVGGLVLVTPFKSISDIVESVSSSRMLASLVKPFWSVVDILADEALAKVPLCIVHPTEDELVPLEHAEELLSAAAAQDKHGVWPEGEDHNWQLSPRDLSEVRRFLIRTKALRPHIREDLKRIGRTAFNTEQRPSTGNLSAVPLNVEADRKRTTVGRSRFL